MQVELFNIHRKATYVEITVGGFSLIESMLALALLAAIMVGIIVFNAANLRKKDALILSDQTEAFAAAYAKYMKQHFNDIQNMAAVAPYTLSPTLLGAQWPIDLSMQNKYLQTPCVTIVRNTLSNNLEAIMYYVSGSGSTNRNLVDIFRSAANELGDKGGMLSKGKIIGNSGWELTPGSPLLSGASQCGGTISNNSIVINMDLLLEWNQHLQPIHSLLRGLDDTPGLLSLPGHVKNSNTSKTNLYFSLGDGIVLDQATSTKLAIAYNGQGTGAPTLGLNNSATDNTGNTPINTLIGDTFQPDVQFEAGNDCLSQEAGKIVADKGIDDVAHAFLSRSTLVCTQNDLLCGLGNYCYLPTLQNKIVFQNTFSGIQDAGGQFICPKSVPFALDIQTSALGGNQIYVIANTLGNIAPNSIHATLSKFMSAGKFTSEINCPTSGCAPRILSDYKSLGSVFDSSLGQIENIDLATLKGAAVAITMNGGNPSYETINGIMGNFTIPVGYRVNSAINACPAACNTLNTQLDNTWQALGTNRKSRIGRGVEIINGQLGCACERTDFNGIENGYNGIAVIIGSIQAVITKVTCSNMPLYYRN